MEAVDLFKEQQAEYARLLPQWMDLVHDVGATELFFIDGDGLLLDLLGSGDLNVDWSHGGQYLHLFYMFERRLQQFLQRDCVFRIIFFNSNRALWVNKPLTSNDNAFSKLVARELLIHHLQRNTKLSVDVFDNWIPSQATPATSSAPEHTWNWETCMRLFPAFVALSDGESVVKQDQDAALMLRTFSFYIQSQRTSAVFASSISLDDNRLMGFVAKPRAANVRAEYIDKTRTLQQERLAYIQEYVNKLAALALPSLPAEPRDGVSKGATVIALSVASILQQCGSGVSKDVKDVLVAILFTSVLQSELSLKYRAQPLAPEPLPAALATIVPQLLDEMSSYAYFFIHKYANELWKGGAVDQDISFADFFDGRLLHAAINTINRSGGAKSADSLGLSASGVQQLNALIELVHTLSGVQASLKFPIIDSHAAASAPELVDEVPSLTLFPIEHTFIQQVLGDSFASYPHHGENDTEVVQALNDGERLTSGDFWNLDKAPLQEPFWTQTSKRGDAPGEMNTRRAARSEQVFARFIHRYAESLEGAALHQKTMVLDNKGRATDAIQTQSAAAAAAQSAPEPAAKENPKDKKKGAAKKGGGGGGKKGGAPKKSKAEEIREQNLLRLKKKEEDSVKAQWDNVSAEVEKFMKEDPRRVEPTLQHFINTCPVPAVLLEAKMFRLHYYFRLWAQDKSNISKMVPVFIHVHKIADHHPNELDADCKKFLQTKLLEMGFVDSAMLLTKEWGIPLEVVKNAAPARSSIRFMLEHMGHLLKRKESSGPDPRVGFSPDNWQKELLDTVDRKGSALVCAPTSSGKTFISYYCMEQVLREGLTGVTVYVSPTKALVNQVAAEVYARFGHLQAQFGEAVSVFGYFTRDFRYKPLKCRVLVTVPECFEALMLSPSPEFEEWRKRVKYVVFDEVHSIGDLASGEIWEHLLSMVDCPFLALSATISNPDDFKQWMETKVKLQETHAKKRGLADARFYDLTLIAHHNRYADLEKSNYVPMVINEAGSPTMPLSSVWDAPEAPTGQLFRLHPCVSLSSTRLKERGFPSDTSFEPRDIVELYDAMVAVAKSLPAEYADRLTKLDPESFEEFQNLRRITRPQSRNYERLVKAEFHQWAKAGLDNAVDSAIDLLAQKYRDQSAKTEQELAAKSIRIDSIDFLTQHIVDLLCNLAHQDRLPAIVFCFDPDLCEQLLEAVVDRLEKEEFRQTQTTDEFKQRRALQKARDQQARQQKQQRDVELKKKTALQQVVKESTMEYIPDEADIDPRYSFAMDGVELEREADDIIRGWPAKMPWVRAVKRGIGIHHASLPTKYRQAVERLFRVRAMQVVFATSTLSLGINMPCKTVIFAGDHVGLNAVSFRQMSGRAGRRGFDKLGRVLFFGVPMAKINRLLTGDLPSLQGNFPSTTSLVQRCTRLMEFTKDKELACDISSRLFGSPLSPFLRGHTDFYFRFSIEYLLRKGLIDSAGHPFGLAELTSYLYWIEPSNFAIASLLKSGALHRLCSNTKARGIDVVFRELLTVLSSVQNVIPMHESILSDNSVTTESYSKVIMDPLSDDVRNVLNGYNAEVISMFVSFAKRFIEQSDPSRFLTLLPTSKLNHFSTMDASLSPAGSVIGKLRDQAVPHTVRSCFSALSGQGDIFTSVQDLVDGICDGIYVDNFTIPVANAHSAVLNRYAVDFFEHTQLKLIKENNSLKGEAWNALKANVVSLQGLRTSLHALGPVDINPELGTVSTNDAFISVFGRLTEEFVNKFNKITWLQ